METQARKNEKSEKLRGVETTKPVLRAPVQSNAVVNVVSIHEAENLDTNTRQSVLPLSSATACGGACGASTGTAVGGRASDCGAVRAIADDSRFDPLDAGTHIIPPDALGSMFSARYSIAMHWLAGSIPNEKLGAFAAIVGEYFGPMEYEKNYGRYGYNRSAVWSCGVELHVDDVSTGGNVELHNNRAYVSIPGGALDNLPPDRVISLVQRLYSECWLSCSRIDIACDDNDRVIKISDLAAIADAGHYAGFQRHDYHVSRGRAGHITGETLSFGARGSSGSGKYLRVYDKMLETNGARDCIRYECEYSGQRAKDVFSKLAEAGAAAFWKIAAGTLTGCIRFLQRVSKNLSRCKTYNFWSELVYRFGSAVPVLLPVIVQSIERTKKWLGRVLPKSLALICRAWGGHEYGKWMDELLQRGLPHVDYSPSLQYDLDQHIAFGGA